MSKSMTLLEINKLIRHIFKNHSFSSETIKGKIVKYIDPHIDTRDFKCFAVTFRGFGFKETTIHTQNECRELKESLFERCMTWLDSE